MSRKSAAVILVVVVASVAAFFAWRSQDQKAKAAKMESAIVKGLTAEEIKIILNSEGSAASALSEKPESRLAFLKGMREYLALAAQARREGMADDPNFQINLNYKKKILLSEMYLAKLSKETGSPYVVPKEDLDAVWSNPKNETQFTTDMGVMRTIQLQVAKERGEDAATIPELAGGGLAKARDNWARAKVMSERANADVEFMSRPEIPLRIKILEAGILSADYLRKYWAKSIKATEQDTAAYLADHPELDAGRKKEQAESLLKRLQAGEDFEKLAREFSEDRISKPKGGLYQDVTKDMLWIEVENAALNLEKGQLADRLIETHTGYHIVKLENKRIEKGKDGVETVKFSVRQILLQKNFIDPSHTNPDIPAPFLTPLEIAKAEVEKDKRRKFVDSIVQLNNIELPNDLAVN